MSKRRFIHPDFWTDPTLGKLNPLERLFFIGCFSNADDDGRLLANAAYLRSTIFQYDDISFAEIMKIRNRVVEVCKNLVLYEADGEEYMAFNKWGRYQRPKYYIESKFPAPPGYEDQTSAESDPNQCQDFADEEPNEGQIGTPGRVGLVRDGMGRDESAPPPDASPNELAILREFKQIKDYKFDYLKDLELIRRLAVDFPEVNLLEEAKKWRTYKIDKPLAKNSSPRAQFRTWVSNSAKWAGERSTRPTSQAPPSNPLAAEKQRTREMIARKRGAPI